MRRLNEPAGDDPVPSVDGIEVEEFDDEDTLRTFMGAWRKRVGEEYLRSFVATRADAGTRRSGAATLQ